MAKMDNEQSQLVAFQIISASGLARALVHESMEFMRRGDFAAADEKMQEAQDQLVEAHRAQTDLLQQFADGTEIEIQIIMVHAQDHLMTTMTLKEVAEEMKALYQEQQNMRRLLQKALQ